MDLLEQHNQWKADQEASLREQVRASLRAALASDFAGSTVWVYGSLTCHGTFTEHSDVDLAFESLPEGMTLEYAQSLLSSRVGREVDICFLEKTRLRDRIIAGGEKWTL